MNDKSDSDRPTPEQLPGSRFRIDEYGNVHGVIFTCDRDKLIVIEDVARPISKPDAGEPKPDGS